MAKKQGRVLTDAEDRTLRRLEQLPAGWVSDRITQFSTNDGELAQTYADMMEKRKELHPGALTPPTFGELFGLASAYLARSGRLPAFPHTGLSITKTAAPERTVSADGSSLCLRFSDTDRKKSAPAEGDRLLLVRAEKPSDLLRMAEHPTVRSAVKWESDVDEAGILPTVLPRISGICYDLRRLTALSAPTPLDRLFVSIPGARLMLIDVREEKAVLDTAAACGATATIIAALTSGDETLFAYSDRDILRVGTPWLRSLPVRGSRAVSVPEDATPSGKLTRTAVAGGHSPYLGSSGTQERLTIDGFAVSSAVRTITGNAYRAAMATVLAPLLSVAASGADYTGIRLGIGLRLPTPNTEAAQGTLMALILAVYRTQMEFACPAALFAEIDDSLPAPQLTVYAAADAAGTVPSGFSGAGNGVFCVTPVFTETGIPDFPLLRQLLREVRGMALAGKLFSARAAVTETLGCCIARSSNGLTCRLSDTAETQLPVGLVLEGTGLPFSRVGTVETAMPPVAASASFAFPPMIGKYIWSDRYEIAILARPGDASAVSLAAALRSAGADCTVLCDTADGPVSRRILTARILVLCPGAVLPAGDKTTFALRMLTGNGGVILRLGQDAPTAADFPSVLLPGRLPDGFLRDLGVLLH